MLLKPDSRLGHYIIREHKGQGGMGAVYRARDARHGGREVAIKTILADKASDRDFLSRFRLEALAVAQIDHPNIVKLIEFVEGDAAKDEPSYMVMEFLKGDDLGRIVKKGGRLDITRAVDLMLEVCAAVGTCHRRGYLHRDLKPSNIFVAVYDQIETIKVLDFGAVKTWADVAATTKQYGDITKRGTILGTVAYQAPELIRGEPATPRSDQYALGVVLYETLTGQRPFRPNRPEYRDIDVQYAISKGEHPSPRSLRPEIPEGLDAAIERAMHRDPAGRFASVHELGAALLPFASTPARHRYTAHFTSAPAPLAVRAQLSIAINAAEFAAAGDDATIPAATIKSAGDSTLAVHADRVVTRPLGSTELKLVAGGETRATTVREHRSDQSLNDAVVDPSISIAFQDPDAPGEKRQPFAADVSSTSTARRPARLVAAAAGVAALALGLAYALHRSGSKPTSPLAPPAAILNPAPYERPHAPPAGPPPIRDQQLPQAPPAAPTPKAALPVETAPVRARPHRLAHRKKATPDLDEKGVPIPSL